jgi:hypothetical protein
MRIPFTIGEPVMVITELGIVEGEVTQPWVISGPEQPEHRARGLEQVRISVDLGHPLGSERYQIFPVENVFKTTVPVYLR